MRRFWRMLRSPRLAAMLLVGLTLYAWVGAIVPQTAVDPAASSRWDVQRPLLGTLAQALGLHFAFSNPVFLLAVLLLAVCTFACAWERTRVAIRRMQAAGTVTPAEVLRIRERPLAALCVPAHLEPDEAMDAAEDALRGAGLGIRRGAVLIDATSGKLGLFGSSMFHWALVGLIVFVGLGQISKYEGSVNVLVGDSFNDSPSAYMTSVNRGALSGFAFTGKQIALKTLDEDFTAVGLPRGPTPYVEVSDEGRPARGGWVYPNSPLRSGALLIQRGGPTGPALVGTVRDARVSGSERLVLYYDSDRFSPRQFSMRSPSMDGSATVLVAPAGRGRVSVSVLGTETTATVGAGETVDISEGVTLTIDRLTYWAQIRVVNDWSVPFVYAMFILGTLGVALTVFVPPRTVRVLLVGQPMSALHVAVANAKVDPAFPGRVERALRLALAPVDASARDKDDE